MEIEIKKLTADMAADYLHFFDDIAFCDNPDWSACYCCFYHFPAGQGWKNRAGSENRELAAERIAAGSLNGFIAYIDSEPAGWVNAGNIRNYIRLTEDEDIQTGAGQKKAAIVCFVIDPSHRGKGIASALLKTACEDFEQQGYELIEVYPRKETRTVASKYHGTVNMYERNGFSIVREFDDVYIMQKIL